MLKVGLTGGIGSGKSTVAQQWEACGAFVIFADELAKKLMTGDEAVKKKITDAFGQESYHPDGTLNRVYLAKEAFGKGRVETLNKIVHPAVYAETDRLFTEAEAQGYAVAVKEAALLLKNGRPDQLDIIVLVEADREKRIEWVAGRDGASPEDVISRMKKQDDFDRKKHLCDYVIRNDQGVEQLQEKAKKLYKEFQKQE